MEDSVHEGEEGVAVPFDRISPDALYNMLSDYVSREWSELADAGFTHEDKIMQIMQQLKDKKAKVLFDLKNNTWNIVEADEANRGGREAYGQ